MGNKFTEEHKANIGKGNKGKVRTDEAKKKMSIAHTGKKLSAEHRAKLSTAWKTREPLSAESKAQGAEKMRGQKRTQEQKDRISAGMQKANQIKVTCEHCQIKTAKNMHTRWHGDNCKSR